MPVKLLPAGGDVSLQPAVASLGCCCCVEFWCSGPERWSFLSTHFLAATPLILTTFDSAKLQKGVMLTEAVKYQQARSPRRLNAKLPKDLETVCLKCLQKTATQRDANGGENADELGRFRSGRPVRARAVQSHPGSSSCSDRPVAKGTVVAESHVSQLPASLPQRACPLWLGRRRCATSAGIE